MCTRARSAAPISPSVRAQAKTCRARALQWRGRHARRAGGARRVRAYCTSTVREALDVALGVRALAWREHGADALVWS